MKPRTREIEPTLTLLGNGVRVVHFHAPHLETANVSAFVRSGSAHESRALNGISHVIEHMVFKGTRERSARRINLDAERLGAQVDAHTDKDHSAFHMRGLGRHGADFIRMLGDIVCHPVFPAEELERERQVVLHEFADDEDDPVSLAYRLFDRACYGLHPVAQPVIGTRSNIERFVREDLIGFVARQYTGANVVVAAMGPQDLEATVKAAEDAFGEMPAGTVNSVVTPTYAGGVRTRAQAGSSQSHLVLGFPIPPRAEDNPASLVAAALFGEGMSSPLMGELREQRGLVYHAACSADVMDGFGQFVVEASTGPEKVEELLQAVVELLVRHAERVDAVDLDRARNQMAVRMLQARERPMRHLENAVLDLFSFGELRSQAERLEHAESVNAEGVRLAFEGMLAANPSLALAGRVGRRASERTSMILGGLRPAG